MKTFLRPFAALLLVMGILAGRSAAEEVRPLEFVHALQEKGYHEVVVEYLKMLKQQPKMDDELSQVWDLEMSKSLRAAANQAFNRQEHDQMMAEAQKHLDAFLKTKPDSAEAVTAIVSWGNLSMDRALQSLRAVKNLGDKDKEQRTKLLAEARAALEEAKPRFQQAVEKFENLKATLPALPTQTPKRGTKADREAKVILTQRQLVEAGLVNAQFQLALLDYYTGQTFEEPKSEPRLTALQRAAKQFDDIYQKNRVKGNNEVSEIGVAAHMWYGKTVEDLGDQKLANDVYEEVLVNEDSESEVLDPLFAQVRQFSFAILAHENPQQFRREATEWLKAYGKRMRRYEGYQAVALELAKMLLKMAEQAPPAEKTKLSQEAMQILGAMRNIPSPYQQEALQLRQKHGMGADAAQAGEAKTFEVAVSLARTAAESGNWNEALTGFTKAMELSGTVKDKERVAAVQEAQAQARLMVAQQRLRENKAEECLTMVGTIVREQKESQYAPAAAALGANAALILYAAVPSDDVAKKQKALDRLKQIVSMTESNWPGKAEADDARMFLGKASFVERKFDDAIKVFEKVDSRSERYPVAQYLAAYCYWQRYVLAKRGEEGGDKEKAAADRAKAVELATASLAEIKKRPEQKGLGRQQTETLLLLADMALEASQPAEAVSYIQPLMDAARNAKPDANDNLTFRTFYTATQAYLAAGQTDRASGAGMTLADIGADLAPVNMVLVKFAAALDNERKKADAEVTKATAAGDAKGVEAAKAKLASAKEMMGTVLKKLAARKNHAVSGKMALADLCSDSGFLAEAEEQYKAILAIPDVDKKAATRARAKRVGLLRKQGKFDDAYSEVKQLMADNPKALEPRTELAQILTAWAEKDPRHYEEAVAQWMSTRNLLYSMKKKPPEYFEVTYQGAYCIAKQADAETTSAKAREKQFDAYRMLKSTLVQYPNLSGPDMVAKYNALMAQLEPSLGLDKNAKKGK